MATSVIRPKSYITFRLGEELFAIDVECVREVLDMSDITHVPTAPDYMLGVVNVRGGAVPVVDLRMKFGLTPRPFSVVTRILVLELELDGEWTVVGGLADSVHDVVELDASEIRDPPRLAMRWRAEMVAGLARRGEQFIILLDIGRVFSSDGPILVAGAAGAASVQAAL